MTDLEKELLATCKSLLSAMRDIVSQLPTGEDLADYRLDQCERAEQQAIEVIRKSPIDFSVYTDEQIGLIYKATIGYNGHAEGWMREDMIEVLNEYHANPETGGVIIPLS